MTSYPKLFLDSCIARPIAQRLLDYYRPAHPGLAVTHLHELYEQSICDADWIPKVAAEGGWIIVTKDAGRRAPRLPEICQEQKITCVVFGPSLATAKVAVHQEALDEVMRNIDAIYRAPPGVCIRLSIQSRKGGIKFFELCMKGGQTLGSFLAEGPRVSKRGGGWVESRRP